MGSCTYSPLVSGKEIRLLELLPGQTEDDIEIELLKVKIDAKNLPQYEALSYVWGSTDDRSLISVCNLEHSFRVIFDLLPGHKMHNPNAGTMTVTSNLEVALRHLRLEEQRRRLWIDAICINQDDIPERSAEVAGMGRIYSRASQVLIWLGPESRDSALAMETLLMIGQDVVIVEESNAWYAKAGSETELLIGNRQAILAKEANWIAIKNLLDRDWFKRLWIVQEIQSASQATIIAGKSMISSSEFFNALQWIWGVVTPYSPLFRDVEFGHLDFLFRKDISIKLMHQINGTKNSLCTDSRDRVYAILNSLIAQDLGIVPDYNLSPEEVYIDFTTRYIKAKSSLGILPLCTGQNQGLPSWVPDLSTPCPTSPIIFALASGASSHAFNSAADNTLRIHGVIVTEIGCPTGAVPQRTEPTAILDYCRQWVVEGIVTAPYRHGGSMLDAFLCTLVAGRVKERVPSRVGTAATREDCRRFYHSCIQSVPIGDLTAEQFNFIDDSLASLPGRAFFTTADGYIGLCPATARLGDQVCIALGCEVPLLLRPLAGHVRQYRLMGECYVHGLMHAEGLLGPIPNGWETKIVTDSGFEFQTWEHASHGIIHEDPRIGQLPDGWRRRYIDPAGNYSSEPSTSSGGLHRPFFEDIENKSVTLSDPRLSPQCLAKKGVNIKEVVLV